MATFAANKLYSSMTSCAGCKPPRTTSHSGSPAPSDSIRAPQADKNGSRFDNSGRILVVDCSR